jgi:hypothetical protein
MVEVEQLLFEVDAYLVTVDGTLSTVKLDYRGDSDSFLSSIVRVSDAKWRDYPLFTMYGANNDRENMHLVIVQHGNKDKWLGENRRVGGIFGAFMVLCFAGTRELALPVSCSASNAEEAINTLEWFMKMEQEERERMENETNKH